MKEINVPEVIEKKLVGHQFSNVTDSVLKTIIFWLIDSKYRTTKRLDSFIGEQISNPPYEVLKLAKQFSNIKDPDEKIVEILKYVINNFRYKTDQDNYGRTEYWANATETIRRKLGDCDDLNSLVGIIALLSGISPFSLYFAIGDTAAGGHFWILYYSFATDKLVSIDATYYPDELEIKYRPEFKKNSNTYKSLWYVFNNKGIYKEG